MADDQQYREPSDRSRVNLSDAYEVRFWMMEFGCTEEQLRAAAKEHGDSAAAIGEALKKAPAATIMEWD